MFVGQDIAIRAQDETGTEVALTPLGARAAEQVAKELLEQRVKPVDGTHPLGTDVDNRRGNLRRDLDESPLGEQQFGGRLRHGRRRFGLADSVGQTGFLLVLASGTEQAGQDQQKNTEPSGKELVHETQNLSATTRQSSENKSLCQSGRARAGPRAA